jgi:hypothetical protein
MAQHTAVSHARQARWVGGIVAALLAGSAAVGAATASADPIDCPAGQTSVKVADGWTCENRAGHDNMSEDPKNPNADKSTF